MAKKRVKQTSEPSRTRKALKNKSEASRKRRVSKRRPTKKKTKVTKLPSLVLYLLIALVCVFLIVIFYYVSIRPNSYRWRPCHGEKYYGVCLPTGFKVHGLDISHHQGKIDWARLAIYRDSERPLRFVFMKATEGTDFKDVTFNANLSKARESGFICGAYHFFSPRSSAEKQAQFFIQTVALEKGDLPPVLDVEVIGKHSKSSIKDSVKVWLNLVEKHYKIKPILYTSYKFKNKYLNDSVLNTYPFWIAHYYVPQVKYEGLWQFWQHTDVGEVPGIEKKVDMNVFNGTFDDLEAMTLR